MMQMGFYFDQSRCTGCFTCNVACKDWHDVAAEPASWLKVTSIEKGKFPDVSLTFLVIHCYHCAEPLCVSACPVAVILKRDEDGIVAVNRDECLGGENCSLCQQTCPYDGPQFGKEKNPKMQKCDFCHERLSEGKKPICVEACPMRALDAGPIDELYAKYGNVREAEGFMYYPSVMPSIIFKQKK
jgi:anaerobic dimethyl sulfoxide reductase subunit B (iron-sulfur subunit)